MLYDYLEESESKDCEYLPEPQQIERVRNLESLLMEGNECQRMRLSSSTTAVTESSHRPSYDLEQMRDPKASDHNTNNQTLIAMISEAGEKESGEQEQTEQK